MISKIETLIENEFYIVGISIRTTNQNNQSGADISGLWTKFMQHNLIWEINNRLSDDIYCAYTDYETDHTGPYTAVLGCKVSSLAQIPDGFTGITVKADKYQVYNLEGKFPDNVAAAWQHIWDNAVDRKYTTDFDKYYTGAKSFAETEAEIHIAVK